MWRGYLSDSLERDCGLNSQVTVQFNAFLRKTGKGVTMATRNMEDSGDGVSRVWGDTSVEAKLEGSSRNRSVFERVHWGHTLFLKLDHVDRLPCDPN